MKRRWTAGLAISGCAALALSGGHSVTAAQDGNSQLNPTQQNAKVLTLEGPAIHVLVTAPLSSRQVRKLATDSRTAREHPDLARYYESKARRLQAEAEDCQRIARRLGDAKPFDAPDHFNIGRNARHYHVIAKRYARQSQNAGLMAALYAQAAQGEGCFMCHNLHGRGGQIGPDLAVEGNRRRSDAWLIRHFKDPQSYSPASRMPPLDGLTDRELQTLARFLQSQKAK